jgi:hypothetical protein
MFYSQTILSKETYKNIKTQIVCSFDHIVGAASLVVVVVVSISGCITVSATAAAVVVVAASLPLVLSDGGSVSSSFVFFCTSK